MAVPFETCIGGGILVVHDGTLIRDCAVAGLLGPPDAPVSVSEWGRWIAITIDRVAATVENVEIAGPLVGMAASSEDGRRSTITRSRFIAAPVSAFNFSGQIADNDFEPQRDQAGLGISEASDVTVSNNRFRGQKGMVLTSSDRSRPGVRPTISDNEFDCYIAMDFYHPVYASRAGDAVVRNNQFRSSDPAGYVIRFGGSGDVAGAASPLIADNILVKTVDDATGRLIHPLIEIDGHYSPVLEGNSFETRLGRTRLTQDCPAVVIKSFALPDLGGGRGTPPSRGGNRFLTNGLQVWSYESSIPREIFARDNVWRRVPVRIFSGGDDLDTRGAEVSMIPAGSPVTVHTEGARSA